MSGWPIPNGALRALRKLLPKHRLVLLGLVVLGARLIVLGLWRQGGVP